MNFRNDALRLKEAIGKDTKIFIEVFNERSKRVDAFIEEATHILQHNS